MAKIGKINKVLRMGRFKTPEEVVAHWKGMRLNNKNSWQWKLTFIGQGQQHNYYMYYWIDQVFQGHPHFKKIVEIGTGAGAVTIVLALWGIKLGGVPVLTIDRRMKCDKYLFDALKIIFRQVNEWDGKTIEGIEKFIGGRPTFMLCDGSNKAAEVNFWAPKLSKGSVIAAHDWGSEIWVNDVSELESKGIIKRWEEEWWLKMNNQLAVWEILG